MCSSLESVECFRVVPSWKWPSKGASCLHALALLSSTSPVLLHPSAAIFSDPLPSSSTHTDEFARSLFLITRFLRNDSFSVWCGECVCWPVDSRQCASCIDFLFVLLSLVVVVVAVAAAAVASYDQSTFVV